MRTLFVLLLLAVTGTTRAAEPTPMRPPIVPALFAYEAAPPPAATIRGTQMLEGVTVTDLELALAGPERPSVPAFLVRPQGSGPFAAVLWVHWLGHPDTTNRTQFLAEATALAREGVVSLLVDTMWARPEWYRDRRFERDRDDSIAQVVALRRALDGLLAEPGIDPARTAIVAHDYGAMHSVILAGVDHRVPNFVLIAGTPSLLDWAFYVAQPESMEAYVADMRAVELKDYLAHTGHATFLHQYAEVDKYVPLAKAVEFFTATAGSKQLAVYSGATHAMTEVPAIRTDRTNWLRRRLSLR